MKKKRIFVTCLTIVVLTLALTLTASAASKKKKAVNAYKKFLSKSTITIQNPKTKVKTKKLKFAVVYLDNDNIPELIIDRTSTLAKMPWGAPAFSPNCYLIYKYTGKVKQIAHANSNFAINTYFKGKSIFVQSGFIDDGNGKKTFNTYNHITGSKLTQIASQVGDKYLVNNKEATKADYEKEIKKYTGGASPTSIKYYKNTASNRKKKIK